MLALIPPYRTSPGPVCPMTWSRSTCARQKLENGDDFLKVNPRARCRRWRLISGELITEGPVIVQIIADKAADKIGPRPRPCRSLQAGGLAHLSHEKPSCTRTSVPQFAPGAVRDDADGAKAFFKDRVMGESTSTATAAPAKSYLMGKRFRSPTATCSRCCHGPNA